MLADHAARVAPGRARLRAKAERAGGEAQGQAFLLEDLLADQIGHRHFGGRDQPVAVARAEQVLAEFRQLIGAEHRGIAHQNRRVDLEIAVLAGVQIEHELHQRPLHPRQRALQHHETRAGELGRRIEIHQAERLADLDMLLRPEPLGKLRRRAEAADLDIVVLVLALGRVFAGQVRDRGEFIFEQHFRRLDRGLEFRQRRLQLGDLVLQRLGDRGVLARHRGADFLRCGVASLLRDLQGEDRGASLFVEIDQALGARGQRTAGESLVKRFRIVAYRSDIMHDLLVPSRARSGQPLAQHIEAQARHYQKRP